MQRMAWIIAFVAALTSCAPHQPSARNHDPCEALRSLIVPGADVMAAERVAAGALAVAAADVVDGTQQAVNAALGRLPSFCRVKVAAKPGPGSDIRIEVWLPTAGWNGKLQAVGEGGLAGFIPYALMAPALAEGYATAGHGYGPRRRQRGLHARASRQADRFRLSIDSRDGRGREGRHRRLLRQRAELVVLQRLLRRRPARPDQRPTLPRRLSRHRRRRRLVEPGASGRGPHRRQPHGQSHAREPDSRRASTR